MSIRIHRRRSLRPPAVLTTGFPTCEVIGLREYRRRAMVDLSFNYWVIPKKRLKDFPLGKKFKLVPIE